MKIALLDRDGTIIVDPPDFRVKTLHDLHFFDDTVDSLKYLNNNGFEIILITNQAGVGEEIISEEQFTAVHNEMLIRLNQKGVRILDTFMCSAKPNSDDPWRKPNPGMLIEAAKKHKFKLDETYMVGDRLSDVEAGVNAGCKSILVDTGWDIVETNKAAFIAPTLMDAVKYIVENS
ncbi:MAG: HAD family hydrolase [bacterium]|nr:HAD family hydrolase [bacterium]